MMKVAPNAGEYEKIKLGCRGSAWCANCCPAHHRGHNTCSSQFVSCVPAVKDNCHTMCFSLQFTESCNFSLSPLNKSTRRLEPLQQPPGCAAGNRSLLRCSAALHWFGTCVKEDEIKANKNHIKEYYSLTAISLQLPVSFWWIPHLVQWMV